MSNFRTDAPFERAPIFDELPLTSSGKAAEVGASPGPPTATMPGKVSNSPIATKIIAVHAQQGLMAIADSSCAVRVYKQIDATQLGISCRPDWDGRQRGWILTDTRDLPSRTGIRSKVISMEFTPEGTELLIATVGRNALTTLCIDPETGCVVRQSCTPPGVFKI